MLGCLLDIKQTCLIYQHKDEDENWQKRSEERLEGRKKERKTELNELSELECSKSPSQMSSFAHKDVFLYLHAQTNINAIFIDPTQNNKK